MSMSSSSPVTSFNVEAKSQEPHKLWEAQSTPNELQSAEK